jgi:hypothetical protein
MATNPRGGALVASALRETWSSPRDILTIVLIIGGDVVQKALAQTTGAPNVPAPVCFSFGWVAYAFTALIGMVGPGRLLPDPDYSCKLINLKSGYARDNFSWSLSRVFRRFETRCTSSDALVVEVFRTVGKAEWGPGEIRKSGKATDGKQKQLYAGRPLWGYVKVFSYIVILVQLGIAAIPFALYDNWGIFFVAVTGQALVFLTTALPQWRVEKLSCRKASKKNIALTRGNGARYVAVILGMGIGLDLEDLASAESPRMKRAWLKHGLFVRRSMNKSDAEGVAGETSHQAPGEVLTWRSQPLDLWATRFMAFILAFLWIGFLICVTALGDDAWYLMAVGALGMSQNAIVAGLDLKPERYGIHLERVKSFGGRKVMDSLKSFETEYRGNGKALLDEFFPGSLRPDEAEWWDTAEATYKELKQKDEEEKAKVKVEAKKDASSTIPVV